MKGTLTEIILKYEDELISTEKADSFHKEHK